MKTFLIELRGLAVMQQRTVVEAETKEEAVQKDIAQSGDRTWRYEGMEDHTIEATQAIAVAEPQIS